MNQTLVTIAAGKELIVSIGGFPAVYTAGQTVYVQNSAVNWLFEQGIITSAGLSAGQQTMAVF